MSVGGGASSGNSQTQLDPQIKTDWQSLFDRATSTANSGVPQQQISGLNPQELSAIGSLQQAANVGRGTVGTAIDRAGAINPGAIQNVNPYTAQTSTYDAAAMDAAKTGFTGYDAATMGAAQVAPNTGQVSLGAIPSVQAGAIPSSNYGAYSGLFDQNVTKPVLDAIDLQRQRSLNSNQDGANMQGGEGAFNGSRAGVSDSLTNEAAMKQAGQAVSALALPAFQTSSGLLEQDLDRSLAGQTTNAGNDLSGLLQNSNAGLQTGLANAGFDQSANLTNADAQNASRQFTAGAANTADLTNAGYEQQANLTNADATNAARQFDSGALNTTSQFNAAARNTAAGENQQAAISRAGLSLQDAGLLGQLGQQQQSQFLAGTNAALAGGQAAHQNTQDILNATYQNALNKQNLPLQQLESAFGIIPGTGSGSVTHSSGKSGNVGIGG